MRSVRILPRLFGLLRRAGRCPRSRRRRTRPQAKTRRGQGPEGVGLNIGPHADGERHHDAERRLPSFRPVVELCGYRDRDLEARRNAECGGDVDVPCVPLTVNVDQVLNERPSLAGGVEDPLGPDDRVVRVPVTDRVIQILVCLRAETGADHPRRSEEKMATLFSSLCLMVASLDDAWGLPAPAQQPTQKKQRKSSKKPPCGVGIYDAELTMHQRSAAAPCSSPCSTFASTSFPSSSFQPQIPEDESDVDFFDGEDEEPKEQKEQQPSEVPRRKEQQQQPSDPEEPSRKRTDPDDPTTFAMDMSLYVVSGVVLIFAMEQFIQIGMKLR
ncbi:hypothetical protein CEUSTIGMA_g11936.t1 [Chlamydomonas eustigma]|uniref:Uncharacterized protein n=1 Tax=Chlamydomonas eustigma TaxID=1157962 RepID=A0A250XND0_9CHLO|nr:hypothetical protein CEUSTIGMA_g11936.t1 [Chlamydomonas eustigma]|eukprot:GAX84516.1 hypothetical protein CEUSTIGMA_g11936.t1 [Chlamydomonas eustigma]